MSEEYISGEEHRAMTYRNPGRSFVKPLLLVAAGVVIAGLGFFGGIQYQKAHQPKSFAGSGPQTAGQFGTGGGPVGFNGQRPTLGEVTAVSAADITVKDQNGSSSTFTIVAGTTVDNNGQAATAADIKVGDTVAVIADSSSTTQASRILLNPSFGSNTVMSN